MRPTGALHVEPGTSESAPRSDPDDGASGRPQRRALTALADRLQAKLNGSTVVADQELVELMDVHLDAISGAAIHASGHVSGHVSGHGSVGKQVEIAE